MSFGVGFIGAGYCNLYTKPKQSIVCGTEKSKE
jgi:hypothetical protein